MNNTQHGRYEVGEWKQDVIDHWFAFVYVGGDLQASEMVCRQFCFPQGCCVTIEPVRYIFAGGVEDGVRIGLIQYPPFPTPESKLLEQAIEVGRLAAEANAQWSYSIVTPCGNRFFSRRRK